MRTSLLGRSALAITILAAAACGSSGPDPIDETPDAAVGDPDAVAPRCGDGTVDDGEACDDGNGDAGDGCDATCAAEPGFDCTTPTACTPICGDGLIRGDEACDDDDVDDGDGCDHACAIEAGFSCDDEPSMCTPDCGDGTVRGSETCDDGNLMPDDGCDAACATEPGWDCPDPGACSPICGDAQLRGDETCDDGNTAPDDGCDAACATEDGWSCVGVGVRSCAQVCGNALTQSHEACDLAVDGCSTSCTTELGFACSAEACVATCGDGIVAGAEACDDGPYNGSPGFCDAACAANLDPTCGDDVIQAGEACDDGASNGQPGACPVDCSGSRLDPPGQTSTFSNNTRGFWFTAPVDAVLTAVEVPTDAGTGPQNIAVLRLAAPPPLYSGTTDDFEVLYLLQNGGDGPQAVKVPIAAGDVIGVLASRGIINSYTPGPAAATMLGQPVTLARLGMQFPLATTAPTQVWTESGGSLSRAFLTFGESECGDGYTVEPTEACDDGNLVDGDGCDATCAAEVGFSCDVVDGVSACASTCGDTVIAADEGCDDGTNLGTPGLCDPTCQGVVLDVGAEASTGDTITYGYWFTAPADLTLRGLRVPDVGGAGEPATVEVIRLGEAPGAYVSNNFTTVARVEADPSTGFVAIDVEVAAGDRIGVLGGRGPTSSMSLAASPLATTIAGTAVDLLPLAMARGAASGPVSSVFSDDGTSVARIELLVGAP